MMIAGLVRAEEEGTWEMGVKEDVYVYSMSSVLGIVSSVHCLMLIRRLRVKRLKYPCVTSEAAKGQGLSRLA